jgi:glucosamine--fructose-6-phosphate aminotransferase (isomerizing)
MQNNFYFQDILSQPAALQQALALFDPTPLTTLARRVQAGEFDRLVLTGMGASFYAAYPAWLELVQAGFPAVWVDTAELRHHALPLITPRTLVWAFSQSGRSAEIVALLEHLQTNLAGAFLAVTNDPHSPLGLAAEPALLIHARPEQTVSTRTYLNSLAIAHLAVQVLKGGQVAPARQALEQTALAMQIYLDQWEQHLALIRTVVARPVQLVVLGRGISLASAFSGALIQQEAAKYPALGMQAAEFRHGPVEIAGPGLTAIVLAGPPETVSLNYRLHQELLQREVNSLWLDALDGRGADLQMDADTPGLPAPSVPLAGLPLAEMLPLQLLSVHLAAARSIEPGAFRFIGKITLTE